MEDKEWKDCNILAMAIGEIIQERARQDSKWGADVERIPSISERNIAGWLLPMSMIVKLYEKQEREAGRESMLMTAIEELAEASEAASRHGPDSQELLEELVQCGAVIVKWIEGIQRRRDAKEPLQMPRQRRAWCVYIMKSGEGRTGWGSPEDDYFVFAASAEEAIAKVSQRCSPGAVGRLLAENSDSNSPYAELIGKIDEIANEAARDMLGAIFRGITSARGNP